MTLLTLKTCHPVSVFTKPSPIGIDIPIQRFQEFLYPALLELWEITDAAYDCHGRAYRNQSDDGYYPEVFDGETDYKEVFFDDSLKALSFFHLGDVTKYDVGNATAPIALIYMVNVKELKSTYAYRADEEIRNDVEKFCQIDNYGFRMTDMIIGIDQVFKEYSGWRKDNGVKYRDMHPTHCFRLNFQVLFDINECF